MKLCVIGTRGFPHIEGGVEKYCETIYPLLADDMEVIVFRRKAYVSKSTEYKNICFVDLPSTRIKGFEALLHSFLATLYAVVLHPDVVHIHNIGPALFAPIIKLFSIPVVLIYHSPNYEHKKWGFFAKTVLRFCERVALKSANHIVFVNRFQMLKYSPDILDKSEYIPNGISTANPTVQHDYLDQMNIEPTKYILSVGRITPEKGFHTLIKACKNQMPDGYKLVIAGGVGFENKYMQELQNLSSDIPVLFTGYVYGEVLAQLYSHAGLFVLASENEGFPLVLLEAMSYGLDILASDIPATHLAPLESEDYFAVGNSEELGSKLRKKLENAQSREYDLSAFDWKRNAARLSTITCETTQ